jgi:hypothetical protein
MFFATGGGGASGGEQNHERSSRRTIIADCRISQQHPTLPRFRVGKPTSRFCPKPRSIISMQPNMAPGRHVDEYPD